MVSRTGLTGAAAGIAVGAAATWRFYQVVGSPPARVGFTLAEPEVRRAVEFLDEHPAIDTHAHPGRTFFRGGENQTWKVGLYASRGTFESRSMQAMRAGNLVAACFSAVADANPGRQGWWADLGARLRPGRGVRGVSHADREPASGGYRR